MRTQADWTFREIDTSLGLPKGSAFRGFKQIADELHEGLDFHYLHGTKDTEAVEALRLGNRLYRTSMHAVLLTSRGRNRLVAALTKATEHPRK